MTRWCLLLLLLHTVAGALPRTHHTSKLKCEGITVEMCKELPYNLTSFPNLAGDETAKDASDAISTFDPLINVGCSAQLKFFLCSVYFPMCNEKVPFTIGPCRPLCETVRERCLPLLKDFGFQWPDHLECSRFPLENNHDAMCMKGPGEDGTKPGQPSLSHAGGASDQDDDDDRLLKMTETTVIEDDGPLHARLGGHPRCPTEYVYLNRTAACVPTCGGSHGIKRSEREAAATGLFILSVIAVVMTAVCLVAAVSRRSDRRRPLPECSVLACAAAFACSSLVYLFSLLYRDQISCTYYGSHQLFVVPSISHVPCTTAAVLLYYFGTAGRIWWVILAWSWQSASAGNGRMERLRPQAEMLAWAVPLAAVTVSLIGRSVSADALSGMCYVGAAGRSLDTVFNLVREIVLSILCALPLLVGCVNKVGRHSDAHSSTTTTAALQVQLNAASYPSPHSTAYACVAALYPITSLFYILSYGHDVVQSTLTWHRHWNFISAIKILYDPMLAALAATACLILTLSAVLSSYRTLPPAKAGYVPAVPRIPQPAVPCTAPPSQNGGNARSLHTYSSTPRNATVEYVSGRNI